MAWNLLVISGFLITRNNPRVTRQGVSDMMHLRVPRCRHWCQGNEGLTYGLFTTVSNLGTPFSRAIGNQAGGDPWRQAWQGSEDHWHISANICYDELFLSMNPTSWNMVFWRLLFWFLIRPKEQIPWYTLLAHHSRTVGMLRFSASSNPTCPTRRTTSDLDLGIF